MLEKKRSHEMAFANILIIDENQFNLITGSDSLNACKFKNKV